MCVCRCANGVSTSHALGCICAALGVQFIMIVGLSSSASPWLEQTAAHLSLRCTSNDQLFTAKAMESVGRTLSSLDLSVTFFLHSSFECRFACRFLAHNIVHSLKNMDGSRYCHSCGHHERRPRLVYLAPQLFFEFRMLEMGAVHECGLIGLG